MSEIHTFLRDFGHAVRRRLSEMRAYAIGLHVGERGIHLVQFDRTRTTLTLRAAASVPYRLGRDTALKSPGGLSACINQAIQGRHFKGRRVITCLPPEHLKIAIVDYRVQAGASEEEAILQQARRWVDGALDQWVVDYSPVRTSQYEAGERSALLAMAPRTAVLAYLQQLQQAHLEVEALEIGSVAINRLIRCLALRENVNNVLVVNFGSERTSLTIISGRRLILDRMARIGEQSLLGELQHALEIGAEAARSLVYQYGVVAQPRCTSDAGTDLGYSNDIAGTVSRILKPAFRSLGEEIAKVLIYHASQMRGQSMDIVYLLGNVARWPGIESLLSQLLSLPVMTLNPLASFAAYQPVIVQAQLDPVADFAIAAGCALREAVVHG